MITTLRPLVFVTVAASLSACLGQPAPEGTGLATAEIQVVPAGVGCLRLVYRAPGATADTTRNFTVTPGNAATLDLGYLAAGTYSFRPSAYNVACASVVAATVPSWSGAPVGATIVAGNATRVDITLRPHVTTTSSVDFVVPATAVFVSQFDDYERSAHGYAVMQDGSVRAWGTNNLGQVGDGTTTTRLTPVTIPGLRDVSQIAASPGHACAVLLDGGIRCWGANAVGQLGDGSTTRRLSPVAVSLPGGARARSISVGLFHTCATTATVPSATWCWGVGAEGALGTGGMDDSPTPVAVALGGLYPPTAGHDALTSTTALTCGLHAEGYVSCWGRSDAPGVLRAGSGTYASPVASVFGSGFTDFRLGEDFACGLRPNGTVQCSGDNTHGQLGRGSLGAPATTPETLRLRGVTALRAGDQHACAIADGSVWCWGHGVTGELGDGSAETSGEPRQVRGITDAVSLGVGGMSSCAVRADGTVWCWGANQGGQLGDGSRSNRFVPTRVAL